MVLDDSTDEEHFVEFDPSGRYGRYSEILGKGAMKTVYRGYDMENCKEVAWNKARPPVECSEEQASAVQREIQILRGLHHQGIIRLYCSWVDLYNGDANFITELCSTTLLDYRLKHKRISRKAFKCWGRQILQGLVHLHMQEPPIIHRDLKCENIFVKCRSNVALKIGDFGSATYLDETHHMHTLVGTPEFMAPEMFQEDYNELVDIYSFGMCMLELLTRECPYSECKSLGQIYKKVINGEKPLALNKVTDMQALNLIKRCLLPAGRRPSATELLADPFLQCHRGRNRHGQNMNTCDSAPMRISTINGFVMKNLNGQNIIRKQCGPFAAASRNTGHVKCADQDRLFEGSMNDMKRKALCIKSPSSERIYKVMGRVEDQFTLRLKIRIQESSRSCDIDFPFDLRTDSPMSVAEEMVRTLDYADADLATIADLINKEITALLSNEVKRGTTGPYNMSPSARYASEPPIHSELFNNQFANMSNGTLLGCEFGCAEEKGYKGAWDDHSKFASPVSTVKENSYRTDKIDLLQATSKDNGHNSSDFLRSNSIARCSNSVSYSHATVDQPTFVSSAITKIVSLDGPHTLLAKDWSDENGTLEGSSNGESAATGSDEKGTCRRSNLLALCGDDPVIVSPSCAPSKAISKFKQLPAGIGILLRPSSEHALRRAVPLCINASA
ncbi:hypothetical protein KP509_25G019800 [Ceratopteris richardii]|nr:hypothetical protein KP509_25G019800 [Ceratopteris richardii]